MANLVSATPCRRRLYSLFNASQSRPPSVLRFTHCRARKRRIWLRSPSAIARTSGRNPLGTPRRARCIDASNGCVFLQFTPPSGPLGGGATRYCRRTTAPSEPLCLMVEQLPAKLSEGDQHACKAFPSLYAQASHPVITSSSHRTAHFALTYAPVRHIARRHLCETVRRSARPISTRASVRDALN